MPVTISCPSSLTVNTGFNGADHCTGLAPGLFAAIVPESPYTYSTTGATVSSGSQSAGALFNLGLTTVTYTSVNDPSKSCSFTVTVVDSRAPTLNCTGEIRPCYSANQMYTIPPISATDNCGLSSVQYVITGATSRSGSGVNASGLFNTGTSTITWTATDASGNSSNCQTVVHINALSASVAGQPALSSGASPNTIYLGYGPQALTYSVQVTGGLPPYSYSWSNGSTSSTAAFSSAVVGIHPFTVTVTDDRGCSVVVSTQVEVMDVRCGNKNNQVSLCKGNGKGIICVAPAAVQSHLNNGAMLGSCSVIVARSQETLSEITSTLQVLVRPNPSVGRFGVFVQSENVVERIQLRIVDLMGREMERMVVVPNTFFCDRGKIWFRIVLITGKSGPDAGGS